MPGSPVMHISFINRKYVNFNKNFFSVVVFTSIINCFICFQLLLQLKFIYIIQLLLQLQLTDAYFSVIFLFQLQLQLTENTASNIRVTQNHYQLPASLSIVKLAYSSLSQDPEKKETFRGSWNRKRK